MRTKATPALTLGLAVLVLALVPATAAAAVAFSLTDYPTGDHPLGVATGDFNQDGNLDLATANRDSDDVSVLLGQAGGGFAAKVDHAVGTAPTSVAVGDFNQDGDPDLAVTNLDSAKVSVLLGEEGGGFASKGDHAVGTEPTSVAVGDFNQDGDPDLAVANSGSNNVSVLVGGAGGAFGARVDRAAGSIPSDVAVGDFNQDGDPDLAVANGNSSDVSVLLGREGAAFATKVDHAAGEEPSSVAVGDFNQDGDPDLAVTNNASGTVSVLLGQAGGGFAAKADHAVDTNPRGVAVGDFNQDGDPDLAVSNLEGLSVSLLLGQAGGGFAAKADHDVANPTDVAVGDFNRDGDPDLAASNTTPDTVSVLLNTSPPAVSADPPTLVFGAQPVGTPGPAQAVTITNTGDGSLRVTSAVTAGTNPDDFAKTTDTCTGQRVPPRATCSVEIRFAPTAGGERTAALRIASNGPGGPHELALSGTGIAPDTSPLADTDPSDFLGPVRLRPPTFAAAERGASAQPAARRTRVGTTVSFSLDEAARVTFTVERAVPGRRVGRRCVKPGRGNRRRPRCTRFVRQRGSFSLDAIAGANRFRFTGRLRNRKLRPGAYRLAAVTTDAAGNRSRPKRTRFKIVRR